MKRKFIITFAGVPGSSKTPIANYLSCKLNLPVLNNDAIRAETTEDFNGFCQEKYLERRNERIEEVIKLERSFIYDASIDREWKNWKDQLNNLEYDIFVISLNLSKELLLKLYAIKNYDIFLSQIDKFMGDHESFLKNYGNEVHLSISDQNFLNRLDQSYESVKDWLNR